MGGFDASNYVTKREWAVAQDGTHVPISVVYRKDLVKLDGSDPLLLYGYGSYEVMHLLACYFSVICFVSLAKMGRSGGFATGQNLKRVRVETRHIFSMGLRAAQVDPKLFFSLLYKSNL